MIILVTGGSGSGKSAFAEDLAVQLEKEEKIYLATMYANDKESLKRIQRHQTMRREKKFQTIECPINLRKLPIMKGRTILLECLSNLAANELYLEKGAKENTVTCILEGINNLKNSCKNMIIVSNEVFSDGILYTEETINYLNCLGRLNREIALFSDKVIEVVCAIPIYLERGELV